MMTSSNKARRYLQHHKQHFLDTQNNHQSAAELLVIDPTLAVTSMRKFRARTQQQQQQQVSPSATATGAVPQICVDNDEVDNKSNDDDNGHVAILDAFDQVLENELKRTSVLRTSSLKQNEANTPMGIPVNQQRSFSFALGSSTNLDGQKHLDDDDELTNISKTTKLPATIRASLSKETFSRLFHSLAFRSGNHSTSKLTLSTPDPETMTQQQQQPTCLACQNHPNLDLLPKYKKRPSIFGVLVSKLNTTAINNENASHRCPICKRRLSKSIFYQANPPDDQQPSISPSTQTFSSTSLTSSKLLQEHGQVLMRTKRRRSLPSLFHSLFDFDHHEKRRPENTSITHRPSFSSILTHTLIDSIAREQQQPPPQPQQQQQSIPIIRQISPISYSSVSLADSDDSIEEHSQEKSFRQRLTSHHDSSQLTEKVRIYLDATTPADKLDHDHEIILDKGESNQLKMNESIIDHHSSQSPFLHPPEEKTRNLLVNVFRTRRSNVALGSTETNMVGKQFSVSVINLTTSMGANRLGRPSHSTTATTTSTHLNLLDQRKHALSEENLPSTDGTYIYFTNVHGHHFREKLKHCPTSESTTLREILLKLFEKHHLAIDACNICLRSAPTLPLSLDQSMKHLLLDDLIVTEKEHGLASCSRMNHRALAKTSAGKERHEKRNSTGSAVLITTSKSASATSKRLSSQCMVYDNDDIIPTNLANSNHNQDVKSTNPLQQHQQQTRPGKSTRSSLFTGSIFTRDVNDSNDRPESNLAFVRRKCDEWLTQGIPKLAQLHNYQSPIDECDLKIEKEWQPFLNDQARSLMSESIKLQQEAIYEMLSTEVSYIRQILTMTEIFMASVMILKSSNRDGLLNDIDMEKLFSNIQDVLNANLVFWKDILLPIKLKLEQTGCAMNPSDLRNGFLKFDLYFKSYLHYVLDQKASAEYFKQKLAKDDLFQYLITWIEANFTNRLSFPDLTIKPLQRLTQYKLLLEAIQKRTQDNQQRNDLQEMIHKVATFVNRVNSKLHSQEQEERVRQISDRIGPFEHVAAPPELTSIIQEYNRDTLSHRLDLFRDMPLLVRGYRRQIIQQGPMKMKDAKNSQDVYCYLFTDMLLITKGGKRSGTNNPSAATSSSLTSASNDGQFNRGAPLTTNKILKPPIRVDRLEVREYDRRGGSSTEPNTASFVIIVYSEYQLIESGYLFQTNLSKQWIENIRSTKSNFQLLMEDSKMKLQNAHNHSSNPSAVPTANPASSPSLTSVNAIHHSLPSLSSNSETSLDMPNLKADGTSVDSSSLDEPSSAGPLDTGRRSSKVEPDVFKMVEQTRRNSRTDHKNFGRYYTADGTGTHATNPSSSSSSSSSSINPSSIKSMASTAIIKRMSWNNEPSTKADSSTIVNNELSNTNSFRSVHSSSGVSSTGSFIFSADEESSTTTTTTSSSVPATIPTTRLSNDDLVDELDELDGKSSSSTVIGTDDREQHLSLMNPSASANAVDPTHNSHLMSRLSSSSTNTLTSNNSNNLESTSPGQTQMSSPEAQLRRTPYASVKKRYPTQQSHRSGYQTPPAQQPFRRYRMLDDNDLRASTHTVVYDSSKAIPSSTAIPIRRTAFSSDEPRYSKSSFGGSGNESDYDNNQSVYDFSNLSKYLPSPTRLMSIPVNDFNQSNELTRIDDLLLGDQNEIVLHNDTSLHPTADQENGDQGDDDDEDEQTEVHVNLSDDTDDHHHHDDFSLPSPSLLLNNPQSDNNTILSTNPLQHSSNHRTNHFTSLRSTALDDSAPSTFNIPYRKDPLTARKLLDIRSHLLLNTTLDATEV